MAAPAKYRFGYRAKLYAGATRAYVLVQRDLGPTELARLETDLRQLSSGIGTATAALIDLDVPLSRHMARALFDLSQKLELPMTLSVPPLAHSDQAALPTEFFQTGGRFFAVELRTGEDP